MDTTPAPAKTANIAALIRRQASLHPDSPAVITPRSVTSYRQLDGMIVAAAERIAEVGVSQGDAVGLSFQLSLQHIVAILAVSHAGAVSVPLHPAWSPAMRAAAASRYNVRHVIAQDARHAPKGIGFTLLREDTLKIAANKPIALCRLDAEAPFRVAMSANVTGDPKGVIFSHDYMRRRMAQTGCAWTTTSRLIPADLNFTVGFVFALSALASGAVLVIPESMKPEDLARAVNAHAVSHLFISPAVATQMKAQLAGKGLYFPTLQQLRIIGPPPPRQLLDDLRTRFSPNVVVPYGASELGIIALATPKILKEHPDSVGKVAPWAQVEIVNESGTPQPAGTVGLVRVTCDGMPTGHADPAGRFREGWYYPGDQGRLGADGLLFIEGRSERMLNVNGTRVDPAVIENMLASHPQVQEAVVLPLPAPAGMPVQLMAAVIHTGTPPEDLLTYCTEKLGEPLPRRIFFMKDFPRNPDGTVLRGRLQAVIRKRLVAQAGKTATVQKEIPPPS